MKYKLFTIIGLLLLLCFGCGGSSDSTPGGGLDDKLPTMASAPETGSYISTVTELSVTFSERVKGATEIGNYEIEGSGAGTLTVQSIEEVNEQTYKLNITGEAANGTIFIRADNITDISGNPLSGNTICFSVDKNRPTISSSPASGVRVTDISNIEITFSKEVLEASDPNNYILSGSGKGTLQINSVANTTGNTYLLNISGTSADGPVTITLNNIQDSYGNTLPDNTINLFSDKKDPNQSAYPVSGTSLNSLQEMYITFSEPVSNADNLANYSITGSGKGTLSVSSVEYHMNNMYKLQLTGTPANGAITLTMSNITDLLGNSLTDTTISYVGSLTNPVQTTIPIENSIFNSPEQIEITFSKTVTGAEKINNYILSGSGAYNMAIDDVSHVKDNTYSITLSGTINNGPITISMNEIEDTAGNSLKNNKVHFTGDIKSPEVTSNPVSGSYASNLPFIDLIYNEKVVGATNAGNYSISGDGANGMSISTITHQSGNTYRMMLNGTPTEGTVEIEIDNLTDAAGNAITNNTLSVTIEKSNPTCSIAPASGSLVKHLTSMDITFSERVTGANSVSNYTLSGAGVGTLSINRIESVSENLYRVFFNGSISDGPVELQINNITDEAGNSLSGNTFSYTADSIAPSQNSIEANNSILSKLSSVEINYSEQVIGADEATRFSISGTGAGTLAIDSVTHLVDNSYRVTFSGESGTGPVLIRMNSLTDTCGNHLTNNSISYTIDPNNPTQTADPSSGVTIKNLPKVTVTYSEEVVGADNLSNYIISGSGKGTLVIDSIVQISGNTYQLTLSGTPIDGNIAITLNNIKDLADNPLNGNVISYMGDFVLPEIAARYPDKDSTDVAINSIVQVIFSEPIDGASITSSSFKLADGSNPITGTIVKKDRHIFFRPDTALPANTKIDVTVTSQIKDLVGNSLSVDNTYSFTTKGESSVEFVNDINSGSSYNPEELTVNGDKLFFTAYKSGYGRELWITDATSNYTNMVKNIYHNYSVPNNQNGPTGLTVVNGILYFSAEEYNRNGIELWKSDGTGGSGTIELIDINTGSFHSNPEELTEMNNKLYFVANPGARTEHLYCSDGTYIGTELIKESILISGASYSSGPRELTVNNNLLFFRAVGQTDMRVLWVSDGSNAGTIELKNVYPKNLTSCNNLLYFSGDNGTDGYELWTSDGTKTGTNMIKDINPDGNSNPSMFTVVESDVFFTVIKDTGRPELWKTDGSEGGTVLVTNFSNEPEDISIENLTEYNGKLYFSSKGTNSHFWRSDGTSNGTVKINDLEVSRIIVANTTMYLVADISEFGKELWMSKGTTENTFLLSDIYTGVKNSLLGQIVNVGNYIYFDARNNDYNIALWRYHMD